MAINITKKRVFWSSFILAAGIAMLRMSVSAQNDKDLTQPKSNRFPDAKVEELKSQSDEYWKERLTPEQFRVTRKKGTEKPFTGEYYDNHKEGVYLCAACSLPLFNSEHKFDSGTGWPSFFKPMEPKALELVDDKSFFMDRTEACCNRCGSHLGHVFDDGPAPTFMRYCINSISLKFVPKAK